MANTASAQQQWDEISAQLGYKTEVDMWEGLYITEKRTIQELAKTLGFGTATIQRRLKTCGVERKKPGGAHTPARIYEKMFRLDQRYARLAESEDLAKLCDASPHSIYRVRKEM